MRGYNFIEGTSSVEALVVRPESEGSAPGLVLIPGYSRTAYDMLPVALQFARAGFATVSVTQPGFGQSSGPPDFVGPRTFAVLAAAAHRFAAESYVDANRLGVYGYSRGALAAAQLATRTDLFRVSILGGGIYDFAAAYSEISLPGIRANMMQETGMQADAVRFRSPIHDVEGFDGPVFIIHGADDLNAPPEQARALARRLAAVGRTHELILLPGKDHSLSVTDIVPAAVAFLRRHLVAQPAVPSR
jgi:dipeptidyl aminopeptidase/acylaminoacyl peptidase